MQHLQRIAGLTLLAGLLAWGCASKVTDATHGTGGGGTVTTASGGAGGVPSSGFGGMDVCADGGWWPFTCPGWPPSPGDDCHDDCGGPNFGPCTYTGDFSCGTITVTATCLDFTWSVKTEGCSAAPGACTGLAQNPCNADLSCHWLWTGCATTIASHGCFSATPCASNADCLAGETCTATDVSTEANCSNSKPATLCLLNP